MLAQGFASTLVIPKLPPAARIHECKASAKSVPAVSGAIALLTSAPARALDTAADEIMLAPSPADLPFQIETPLGPIAGNLWQVALLGLSLLSAIATLARGTSDALAGRNTVYSESAQSKQPFGRSLADTIRLASEASQVVDKDRKDRKP